MTSLIIGMFFVTAGIICLRLAFKFKQNKVVKNERIKDKEGYLKFNFKINIMMGIVFIINGIFMILSQKFVYINGISAYVNLITIMCIFIYYYKLIGQTSKFQ
ncbi:hypothetical protein [Clostridium sp. CCUG 7971]|uniref:hypothetical protein n=1 Tax=Clostridium sp. CCUG 7971 TaxID=2811414 RepID=UPI001ABBBF58|nr:hypothetical protein [Clostridium sp. CCUG 7971]MBO3443494.1 hypothetical protein [Clostridium sp. CCUG 7971]